MAIAYTWEFSQFEKAPQQDGLLEVVKVIHWTLKAEDGNYRSSAYGTTSVAAPDPDNYIAYEDITKQWAIDAVSAVLDVPAMEASLLAAIERQKNPPIVSAAPPFSNN
jgi:hypothetical protein